MRRPAWLVLVLLARPAAAQEPAPNVEELFPLAVGNTWTYRVNGQSERFVVRVAGRELVRGEMCYKLEARLADRLVATEYVAFTKAGLCRFRVEQEDIDPPVCILKMPGPKGTTWPAKYALGGRSASGTFSASIVAKEVVVSAQKFKAVKVDVWTGDRSGFPPRTTVWYGVGVGPVRQLINEGKSRLELDLERFEKAK